MWLTEVFASRWVQGIISAAMVVGPTLGFALQYNDIRKNGVVRGFSTWVCFLIIMANILRVFFWCVQFFFFSQVASFPAHTSEERLSKRFDETLLLQSIAMLLTQIALLELCVRVTHHASVDAAPAPYQHRKLLGTPFSWGTSPALFLCAYA